MVAKARSVTFGAMTPKTAEALAPSFAAIDPWSRYEFTPSSLLAYLSATEPEVYRYSISADGRLAGAMVVRLNWLRGPYLQFLGVLPDQQRFGIGGEALRFFEQGAHATQAQNLWVAVSDFNRRAIEFYERHGFLRVAALDELVGPGAAELLLRKRVTLF